MRFRTFAKSARHPHPLVAVVTLLSAVTFGLTPVKAQSADAISEIERLTASGSMSEAMNLVNQQMREFPSNAELHYLRANILAKRGEMSSAGNEYQNVLKLNCTPELREYSRSALSAIYGTGKVVSSQKSLNNAMPASVSSTISNQNNQSTAESAIDRQTRHMVKSVNNQSAAAARQMQAEASQYQQTHSAKTRDIVTRMQNAGFYNQDGEWLPAYDPSDIRATQMRRNEREASVINQFNQSSQNEQVAGQQKASAVSESADGLKSQMSLPARPGDATLNPNGTNLFVRNYAESGAEPKAPTATAQPRPATVTVP